MISEVVNSISSVDDKYLNKAQEHLNNLTKPRGSLGVLEKLAARIYAIGQGERPCVDPGLIYTCAADHGVAAGKVSLFPQEVTRQMVVNFLRGGAAINVLAQSNGLDLKVVDAGVLGNDFPEHELLISRKISQGTADLSTGPAMTEQDCQKALELGIELTSKAYDQGYKTLCTGEMGIGNTTPSTALFCAYLCLDPAELSGAGTGLDSKGISHKAGIIQQSLITNRKVIEANDPLKIMAALGGLEIACLTGIILSGAWKKMNIIVDGYISTAAYVCAWKMNSAVKDYCFFSHLSAEKGHALVLDKLNVSPVLQMDMRLGEGTGAAMAYSILKCAADIYNNMATFEQAGVQGRVKI